MLHFSSGDVEIARQNRHRSKSTFSEPTSFGTNIEYDQMDTKFRNGLNSLKALRHGQRVITTLRKGKTKVSHSSTWSRHGQRITTFQKGTRDGQQVF